MCWRTNVRYGNVPTGCKSATGEGERTIRARATRKKGLATRGQATVEAAFAIPIVFTLLLLLIQPGIILYDRMVMRQAAAEGCRLLATRSASAGLSDERCIELIKRQLAAVPPHDLFHVHDSGCSWDVQIVGSETSATVSVSITNRLRLLPLFDTTGAMLGLADAQGCLSIQVEESAPVQAAWVQTGSLGLNPSQWVGARE